MKLLLTVISIIISTSSALVAQQTAKIFTDLDSYVNKQFTEETVIINEYPRSAALWAGGSDYDITPNNDNIKKKTLKRAWAVERNDSLFINARIIKNKLYGYSPYRNDRYIYFIAGTSMLKEHAIAMHRATGEGMRIYNRDKNQGAIMAGYVAGMSGAAAVAAYELDDAKVPRYNYLINLQTKTVHVVDIPLMQELLEDKPVLDRQYMKEGHPEDPASLVRFFKAAFDK